MGWWESLKIGLEYVVYPIPGCRYTWVMNGRASVSLSDRPSVAVLAFDQSNGNGVEM